MLVNLKLDHQGDLRAPGIPAWVAFTLDVKGTDFCIKAHQNQAV